MAKQGPDFASLARLGGSILSAAGRELGPDVQVEDQQLATDFISAVEALTAEVRRLRAAVEQQTAACDELREQMSGGRRIPR